MPTDREVADAWTAASSHVCRGTSRGAAGESKMTPEFVRPDRTAHWLGKTYLWAVQGREVMDDAARAVAKHPLPIPPSRVWFALYVLCQVACLLAEKSTSWTKSGA